MKPQRLLQIGGIINLLFVVFHLSFWRLFNWKESLALLSQNDSAVMQVLNIHTAYALGIFALLSLVFANELSVTKLGRILCLSIAGFWILRAANQVVFWGWASWLLALICLAIAALYLIPLIHRNAPQNLKPRG